MILDIIIFLLALCALLVSANYFTNAAESIGAWFKLAPFVIGVFIVGIGTSLPELISGIISINNGASEILPGNIIGSNISNILLITGLAVIINRKKITLESNYLYIDLHFLLGSFIFFCMIAYDGTIHPLEASIGVILFIIYSIYLIKVGTQDVVAISPDKEPKNIPFKQIAILFATGVGIYAGADYTVSSLNSIATTLGIPSSIIALTLLSLGTTLPELAVNISAIKKGKAELAIGNVLGSCIFNSLVIAGVGSLFGTITVPSNLLSFSLPMMAVSGLFFYLLTQDKNISIWEGMLIVGIYVLFILQIATTV